MKASADVHAPALLREERGVALPLALIGLILASLLVTGALLSSATEVAISGAHQDASRNLYAAENALQAYIAQSGSALAPGGQEDYLPPGASPEEAADITVRQLFQSTPEPNTIQQVLAVTSTPSNGGRAVVAMVEMRTVQETLNLKGNVPAGLTLGGKTRLLGTANVHNSASTQYNSSTGCSEPAADYKIALTSDATLELNGNAKKNIDSEDITRLSYNRYQMPWEVLGIRELDDLAPHAHIAFGRMFPNRPNFNSSLKTSSPNANSDYNWGCPAELLSSCRTDSKRNYHPLVVIDANGGEIHINQEFGQGMLVILNGDLRMNAGYTFKGIIAVEGVLRFNGHIHLEGAVLSQGVVDESDQAVINGTQDIYYNKCVIDQVVDVINDSPAGNPTLPPTVTVDPAFGWYEVVR